MSEEGGAGAAPVRVVLVDDDPMVRTGLGLILGGGRSGVDVVAEAADGNEALAVVREARPDVVLMDIRMPVMDGLAATEAILAWPDPPRVIVLTTFDTDDMVLRALGTGAAGFLLKDTPPARLVEAVHTVARGEPMLSPSVTAQLIAAVTGPGGGVPGGRAGAGEDGREIARRSLAGLTERELDVARAVAEGLPNADIATRLYMSTATVKAHIGHIFGKLGLDNRVQVAILVHDAHLD